MELRLAVLITKLQFYQYQNTGESASDIKVCESGDNLELPNSFECKKS
jgi:hypothetical protein